MTYKVACLIAASLFASSPALAGDTRIKTIAYDADRIVAIVGHAGIQSTIQFAPDERIENVAVGNSAEWQVTPNRRGTLLFVKPISSVSRTNMTVVTDRRTYMFDLRSGGKAGPPLYSLKFSYADLASPTVGSIDQPNVVMASAAVSEPAAPRPEQLNFDWKVKGSDKLRPARIFDDGESLYLSWSRDVQLPAILTATDKGREAPLDYRVSGEYIVLSPVPHNIVLRFGKNVASAWSTAPRKAAPAPAAVAIPNSIQRSDPIVPDRYAIRTVLATPIPQPPSSNVGQTGIGTPGAADLLSDNLTDGHHDH